MLNVFVMTLREGIEAFLIVAITLAYLKQTQRHALASAVYWGTGGAIALSAIASYFFAQADNKPLWEGILATVAAVLVISCTCRARALRRCSKSRNSLSRSVAAGSRSASTHASSTDCAAAWPKCGGSACAPSPTASTYSRLGAPPVLAVKLQELFGLADTPRVANGRVPVTLELLSPGQRPIQVTQDLRGFWDRTYPEVKKELKGRYPRHPWPDDPWNAVPTARAKPRGK